MFSFTEIRWGWGRDQEFVFGHIKVPRRLPSGSAERIGECMNLKSGLRSNQRSI